MASNGLCFVLVLLVVQKYAAYVQSEIIKSSLTFIIDDTGSMWNEIRQVKEEVNIIFEKVLSSKESQIDNFVIVTFNDPDATVRTITKDKNTFKRALDEISVHGGGDCPEYAMTGIELGLTNSLPLSYLYVFTDASAKDYKKFEQIKSISQKKQSQVVFLLTGECGLTSDPEFQVYHKVADATGGQVFHMLKDDVKDILKYIEESITGRGVTIVNKKYPPGTHKVKFTVDAHTGEVLISLTGLGSKIGDVTGPGGIKPPAEPLVSGKNKMAVKRLSNLKPGDYEVEIEGKGEVHIIMIAKSDINFQLGFSIDSPASIKDTVTRPPPEGNTFLGIRSLGEGIELASVRISDLDNNIIEELPLTIVDKKEQFYITPSFHPPSTMFLVTVIGKDLKTGTPVIRTGPTPIARQDPTAEPAVNKAPQVTILGAPKIIAEYDAPLKLKCTVHCYPAPVITWSEKDTGIVLPAKMKSVDVPYDFVSTLEISKANKNVSYECTASNSVGKTSKYVEVETERKTYFDVIEAPKDIRVEYTKEGSIICKIDAYPPATVTWYKDGAEFVGNTNVDLSGDKSTLTIKSMQPELKGKYSCEARSDIDRKLFIVDVDIFGVEKPVIDKSHAEHRAPEKTNTELSCRTLKGIPKPTISWSFKPVGSTSFSVMTETTETVQLKEVRQDQTGTYQCSAKNALGSDSFTMELIVEYPPTIKSDVKVEQVKDDDEVTISCDVTGEPDPTVTWFFNGTRFDSAMRSRETSDHSLRFNARIADIGSYRCEAKNKLGSATKTTELQVYVPVTIETPKDSNITKMVGQNQILNCRADGYPKPNIKWTFESSDTKIPAKDITPTGGAASVVLRNLQLNQQGLYICEAENGIGGSDSITYDLKVYAPPAIINKYPHRNFEAVKGDVALRIQCNATGSPKPSIIWIKNGLNLAIGSEWYDMEDDGTLIIKNIDRAAEGTYVCRAENILGHVTELYEVTVRDSFIPVTPTTTIHVKEGETVTIDCGIPHSKTDQVRWYKDSLVVASGELTLYSVTRSDDGLYTCRVSNPAKSRSVTTKVVVGYKPEFSTLEPDTVDFVHGADAVILSCEAIGRPQPTTAIWKHNGKTLDFTDMSYPLGMVYGATGMYECEVSNAFGSIRRSFKVTSRDCILDIKKDFPEKNQPIMFSRALTWPVYRVSDGYMVIPHADYFYMNCPSKFSDPALPAYNIMAFCERDNTIKVNGNKYNFADIQCNKEVEPQVSKTGTPCLPGNTEYVKIGYRIHNELLGVFDVCLDKDNNVPLFTKHKLSPDHTDRSTEAPWSNIQLPQDFNSLYDCSRQMYDITSTLGRVLSTRDSCCFGKRQLVNSHDLAPGIPPSTTFDYLNVIPHWSTCSSKNWEDVEKSVRNLVKSAGRDLIITTGTATSRHSGTTTDITLHDGRGGKQAVAPYLWKVIQDPAQTASLAIIQINIPELTPAEVSKHVLCPDICEAGITWIKPSNWQTIEDGYTYCCSIIEFEKAFGYSGRFSPDMVHVLFDGSLMPSSYLP